MSARRATLLVTVALLLVIGLLPVFSMLCKSVVVEGHFNVAAYRGLLRSGHQWALMRQSLTLAFWVTLLALGAGVPLGILLGKSDLPGRSLFTALFVAPLLIPPYLLAISWSSLLGREGFLAQLPGGSAAAAALFGLPGCILVLFTVFLPIPMLLTMTLVRSVSPQLEEAGRLVTGWRGVLRGITLPLILPGLVFAATLLFLLAFGEFSVPNYLRYDVFPVESFTRFSAFYDFQGATAAALPLALVALLLLLAEALLLRRRRDPFLLPGEGPPLQIALGPHRRWICAAVALAATLLVVLPLLALLAQSATPGAFRDALERAGDSLLRSIFDAAIGATLLTLLGFFTGYLIQTRALRFWRAVDLLTLVTFALPGSVIGIGLINLWNTPWSNFIYATPAIIILGYLAKYTLLTSRICIAQLTRIPPSIEESARVAGAGWWRRLLFIVVPQARHGLAAAWLIGYLFCLRDTGITMLVYPPGQETHLHPDGERLAALDRRSLRVADRRHTSAGGVAGAAHPPPSRAAGRQPATGRGIAPLTPALKEYGGSRGDPPRNPPPGPCRWIEGTRPSLTHIEERATRDNGAWWSPPWRHGKGIAESWADSVTQIRPTHRPHPNSGGDFDEPLPSIRQLC